MPKLTTVPCLFFKGKRSMSKFMGYPVQRKDNIEEENDPVWYCNPNSFGWELVSASSYKSNVDKYYDGGLGKYPLQHPPELTGDEDVVYPRPVPKDIIVSYVPGEELLEYEKEYLRAYCRGCNSSNKACQNTCKEPNPSMHDSSVFEDPLDTVPCAADQGKTIGQKTRKSTSLYWYCSTLKSVWMMVDRTSVSLDADKQYTKQLVFTEAPTTNCACTGLPECVACTDALCLTTCYERSAGCPPCDTKTKPKVESIRIGTSVEAPKIGTIASVETAMLSTVKVATVGVAKGRANLQKN
jgi:Na+-translocating ferredoxin:NAD+ oxidoreductase RNF subunit RnfB